MATRTTPFGADDAGGLHLHEAQARRAEIEEQLGRLLASPLFRNSRHYPALLRYVVTQTLEGNGGHLKERSLGTEVFGRDPGYDTNLDPVVRTSACEVRKRIAQYYHEPSRERELRIDLPSGSYVAEFHFSEPPPLAPAVVREKGNHSGIAAAKRAVRSHPVFAGIAAFAVALGAASASLHTAKSALDQFWGPVWSASDTMVLCMGGRTGLEKAQAELVSSGAGTGIVPSVRDVARCDRVAFSDALTMARLFSIIRAHGKKYDVRRCASMTLTDLRNGPVILVGGFNNTWTMRLKKNLRFTFEREGGDPSGAPVIRDRQNPSMTKWRVDDRLPYNKLAQDYAIVSRVVDPLTEMIVVTVAGVTKDGTIAAGEFVTEERYLAPLVSQAPAGWERKNVQVVLGTEVVNGVPGPPHVLASNFW